MALTTDKIKVGDKFYLDNILNPKCDEYGLLTCVKVEVKPDKFCTNPVDYGSWYAHKEHYIDRPSIEITYKNSKGKTGVISFWEDEFKPKFADSQEQVEDIANKELLETRYQFVKQEIRKQYGDIFSLTKVLHDTATKIQAQKILNLMDNLRDEINAF